MNICARVVCVVALLAAGAGFFVPHAHAALISQTVDDATTGYNYYIDQSLASGTVPSVYSFTVFTGLNAAFSGNPASGVQGYLGWNCSGGTFGTCANSEGPLPSAGWVDDDNGHFITYTPSSTISTAGGVILHLQHGWSALFAGGTMTDTYPGAAACSASCGSVQDIFFQVFTSPDTSVGSIAFTGPVNGTTTDDFGFWHFAYNASTTSGVAFLRVQYYSSSSPVAFTDQTSFPVNGSTTSPVGLLKSQGLWTDTWSATAKLYNSLDYSGSSDATLLDTETIAFSVSSTIPSLVLVPTEFSSTSTVASSSISCTGGGFAGDSFCKMFVYLFVPSSASVGQFQNLGTVLQGRAPLSYFFGMKNELLGLQEGTSSLELLDATSTAAFAPVFSPLKTGFGWLLWILFGLWIFHRFRKIDLTHPK